jgi:hypothetical protein
MRKGKSERSRKIMYNEERRRVWVWKYGEVG